MQTLNPEWKETFTFQSIDPNEIHHKQIEITVWDWDRLSADDFLGEVNVDLTGKSLTKQGHYHKRSFRDFLVFSK